MVQYRYERAKKLFRENNSPLQRRSLERYLDELCKLDACLARTYGPTRLWWFKKLRRLQVVWQTFTQPVRVRYCSHFAERAYRRQSASGGVERWYLAEVKVLQAEGCVAGSATFSGKPDVSAMQLTMAHFLRQKRLGAFDNCEVVK